MAHGDCSCQARRLDAWKGTHAFEHAFHEVMRLVLVVTREVRIHRDVECMLRVKAQIRPLDFQEAPQEKAGNDQQRHRASHLRHNQNLAKTMPTGGHGARALVKEHV